MKQTFQIDFVRETKLSNGETFTYRVSKTFADEGNGDYREAYVSDGQVTGYSNMGYGNAGTREQFTQEILKTVEIEYTSAVKRQEEGISAEAARKLFDTQSKPRLEIALVGLSDIDDIIRSLQTAVEYYDGAEPLAELLQNADNKFVRKRLREAYSAARSNVRDEYPEEYREEDDKEDFYNDHEDDIAEAMVGEI